MDGMISLTLSITLPLSKYNIRDPLCQEVEPRFFKNSERSLGKDVDARAECLYLLEAKGDSLLRNLMSLPEEFLTH